MIRSKKVGKSWHKGIKLKMILFRISSQAIFQKGFILINPLLIEQKSRLQLLFQNE